MSILTDEIAEKNWRAWAKDFPKKPGVYLMRDDQGSVIYVGKAKNLKLRIASYLKGGDGRRQIKFLLRRVHAIEKIITQNEQQALVLERDLIAQHKPRYNIKLKDDKAYLSIRVDLNAQWPRLELVRRISNDGARYFGPYTYGYELRALLELISRVVPLRTCSDTVFFNRTRPCLEYQIKRCSGPCCLQVDSEQYRKWLKQAITILEGKVAGLKGEVLDQMERAASELRFEDAALFRDKLSILENFEAAKGVVTYRGENRDVFGIHRESELVVLNVLIVRGGRISESINYALAQVFVDDSEVLESAIEQFYDAGRQIPEEILLAKLPANAEMLLDNLRAQRGENLEFIVPQRGSRRQLLLMAEGNSHEHFLAVYDAERRYRVRAEKLAKLVQLKQIPRRIECVDISNFQESDTVGAFVSFLDGEPDKQRYRRYKLGTQEVPNDFEAIYQVVSRRLRRGKEEDDLPDLIIVDGGPPQLRKALQARDELGVEIDIISLAKERRDRGQTDKPERLHTECGQDAIELRPDDELTQLLQRIRDEVHRFAITFHRGTRAKRVFKSALDNIAGVGPERRERLMRAFGSVKRMKDAKLDELAKAGRMPMSLAEKIMRVLQSSD